MEVDQRLVEAAKQPTQSALSQQSSELSSIIKVVTAAARDLFVLHRHSHAICGTASVDALLMLVIQQIKSKKELFGYLDKRVRSSEPDQAPLEYIRAVFVGASSVRVCAHCGIESENTTSEPFSPFLPGSPPTTSTRRQLLFLHVLHLLCTGELGDRKANDVINYLLSEVRIYVCFSFSFSISSRSLT